MLLTLPPDLSGIVSTFLDTYDANNLRLVSKDYKEEVETLKFAKPVYKENEKGYCKITVNAISMYGRLAETMTSLNKISISSEEPNIKLTFERTTNKNFRSSGKYTLYMYDSTGGWPYFFEDKIEVKSIIESYNTFRKGKEDQKIHKEKREKEEAEKRKKIFLIKTSAKPTNPWKKV